MKPIVAFPFRHHATMICPEAKQMLIDAGFELVCNDTGRKLTPEEQKEMISEAFAVIAGTEPYDRDMLDAAKNLKLVVRFGVGIDNFDVKTMKERGIAVGVISNNNAVAEFTVALMLGLLKNLPRYDSVVREASWVRLPMFDLRGKTVGIVGYGRIGRRVCEILQGFGVRLMVCGRKINPEEAEKYHFDIVTLDELLSSCDIVSLHVPARAENAHMINEDTISKMKDGAMLINTSRGALVDEKALYNALVSGKLAGAALDVFEKEPVVPCNPLFELENVVLAPHAAALTYETNYNAGITCAQSVLRVYKGEDPVYPV